MQLYQKPIITIDSGLCEGIYAANVNVAVFPDQDF